jgi:hypothetical protein
VNESKSTITFTATGTTTTNAKGTDPLHLSKQSWKVDVPGGVLDTGINLGLIKAGDLIKGALRAGVAGRGTGEGQRMSDPVELTLGPVVVDETTGLAAPVTATVALADTSWTPTASTVDFLLAASVVEVRIPLPSGTALTVTFTCTPPADAKPFVSASIVGETATPSSGGAGPSGATVLGATVARTGTRVATTGPDARILVEVAIALALLDLGYLARSAATGRRRRAR